VRALVLGLAAIGLAGAGRAQTPAADSLPPPRTIPELEARIRGVLAETRTPAVGIALVERDSVVWVAGLGKADVASGRDATAETLFRIGSTSKAFVSLLVLLLEGEGKLSLDDRVRERAPEIAFTNRWEETDPVRIVHLLEHATGWDDLALRDYANSDPAPISLRRGLDFNPKTRESRWRPGTRVSYCNSGPSVAAYIVEGLAGRTFEDLVRERLFQPIGMTTATYFPPADAAALATLYHADGVTPFPYWHILQRPAGAINASARDMAAYVRFLLNRGAVDGRQVVAAAAIARMERPASSLTARSGLPLGYGLHLATYVDSQFVWVGHDGGVNGGITMMAYRPEQGVGFAFMINAGNGGAVRRIGRLVRDYLTRDAARPDPPAVAAVSGLARERAGWYRADNPRVQGLYFVEWLTGVVHLAAGDSGLTVKPVVGRARAYVAVDERRFRRPHEPVATLALVDDPENGRPQAIEVMGYLLPGSLHRVPAWSVWLPAVLAALFVLGVVTTGLVTVGWGVRAAWRRLRRRKSPVRHPAVRLWPLAALGALVLFVGTVAVSMEDVIPRFGVPSVWSVTVFLSTVLFPVAAVGGLAAVWRAPRAETGRWVWWYGLVVSTLNLVAAGFFGWGGMIAWRPWG
jgi:CubicO group peptidase (beta-lactamase class C family)